MLAALELLNDESKLSRRRQGPHSAGGTARARVGVRKPGVYGVSSWLMLDQKA